MTNEKTALFQWLIDALPGGAIEQSRARAALAKLYDPAQAKQMGENLGGLALGGVGLGLSGSRLYHLVSELNRKPSKYTKFSPGAKGVDDEEKLASLADIYTNVVSAPGKLIQNITTDKGTRDALFQTAQIASIMGGTAAGAHAMNKLVNEKRKENLKEQVEDAKKQYMRALLSKKHAAALDSAFSALQDATQEKRANLWGIMRMPFDSARLVAKALGDKDESLYKAYVATVLGTGGLAGKMTYDWTRARGRDKAVAEAQKARARMAGIAPIHVDPEQMAALKRVAADD